MWEEEAESWSHFARAPDHDGYWFYRDSFFDEVMPAPGGRILEIGCGEGRVTRDLLARGHRMVAVDGSPTLLRHALGADDALRYALADAGCLPFPSESVDGVVAYNLLMDVDDLDGVVQEAGRVLVDGGECCICLTHPMQYAGGFDGEDPDASYVLRHEYFGTRQMDQTVTRDGITFRFRGWTRPLEAYVGSLRRAGFVIDNLREPRPNTEEGRLARWHRVPMFLFLRAVKQTRTDRRGPIPRLPPRFGGRAG